MNACVKDNIEFTIGIKYWYFSSKMF